MCPPHSTISLAQDYSERPFSWMNVLPCISFLAWAQTTPSCNFPRRVSLICISSAIPHFFRHHCLFHSSSLLLSVQFPTCFNIVTSWHCSHWQVLWYFLTVYFNKSKSPCIYRNDCLTFSFPARTKDSFSWLRLFSTIFLTSVYLQDLLLSTWRMIEMLSMQSVDLTELNLVERGGDSVLSGLRYVYKQELLTSLFCKLDDWNLFNPTVVRFLIM